MNMSVTPELRALPSPPPIVPVDSLIPPVVPSGPAALVPLIPPCVTLLGGKEASLDRNVLFSPVANASAGSLLESVELSLGSGTRNAAVGIWV